MSYVWCGWQTRLASCVAVVWRRPAAAALIRPQPENLLSWFSNSFPSTFKITWNLTPLITISILVLLIETPSPLATWMQLLALLSWGNCHTAARVSSPTCKPAQAAGLVGLRALPITRRLSSSLFKWVNKLKFVHSHSPSPPSALVTLVCVKPIPASRFSYFFSLTERLFSPISTWLDSSSHSALLSNTLPQRKTFPDYLPQSPLLPSHSLPSFYPLKCFIFSEYLCDLNYICNYYTRGLVRLIILRPITMPDTKRVLNKYLLDK